MRKKLFAVSLAAGVFFGIAPMGAAQASTITYTCGPGVKLDASGMCVTTKKETKPATKKWVNSGGWIECNAYPYFGPGNQVDQCKNAVRTYLRLQPDSNKTGEFRITTPVWWHTTWITQPSFAEYRSEPGWRLSGSTLYREVPTLSKPIAQESYEEELLVIAQFVEMMKTAASQDPAALSAARDRAVAARDGLQLESSKRVASIMLLPALSQYEESQLR